MLELVSGWNNGTFQIDAVGSRLIFALYSLDGGGFSLVEGAIYGDPAVKCAIFRVPQGPDVYQAFCNVTFIEVLTLI